MSLSFSTASLETWIACPEPQPEAAARLICLPFAGGGTLMFRGWSYELSEDFEVCAVQLPGREGRLREEPYLSLDKLVQDLADLLPPLLDRPYAFFGHSMGASIAFELTRELIARGETAPMHLFLSGRRAAHIEDEDLLHPLSDEDFQKALRRFEGLSERLFKNERLMRFFLPTLRADFTLFETHTYRFSHPIPSPIRVFGGLEDDEATSEQLRAWEEHTSGEFALEMFSGGHFFLRQHQSDMLMTIAEDLYKSLRRSLTLVPTSGNPSDVGARSEIGRSRLGAH